MFKFKKIMAVLASAVMLSSTMGFAVAASYPAPFIVSGLSDAAVVYGANAATSDVTAAINVQQKLGALATSGSTTTTGTTTGGESYPLFTSSSPLLLNKSINSVRSSVTSTSLTTVLADTTIEGDQTATLTHSLKLGTDPRTVFAKMPTSSDDPIVGVKFSTTISKYLYNATVSFSKAIAFNHSDTEGQTITMFGQEYTIGSDTDGTSIVLLKSAEKISLSSDNPSTEVTISDATYTVELVSASDTAATVRITDSSGSSESKEISESDSKKVNGLEIGITTADETNLKLSATIIVGADRVKLTDGTEIQVGSDSDPIDGTQVNFGGDGTQGPNNITKLVFQVSAPDGSSDAITPGQNFIDPIFGTFKIDFAGLNIEEDSTARETISIDPAGNDRMAISFSNHQGKSISNFEWLNNESGGGMAGSKLGDSGEYPIFVYEMAKINESAFTMVGNEDEGYLIKLYTLSNSSSSDASDDSIRFQNVFDSSQIWSASISAEGSGTIVIGSTEYAMTYVDDRAGNGDAYVQLNSPDSAATEMVVFPTIQTSKGAKLMFYEPLTIDLDDWDSPKSGTASNGTANLTAIKIPDGDGFTSIAIGNTTDAHAHYNYTITIGSNTAAVVDSDAGAANSTSGAIGKLTWNVSATSTPTEITLYLVDPNGGNILNPAIVLFEEKDELNEYQAVIIQVGGNGDSNNGMGVSDVDFTWNTDRDMQSSTGTAYGATGLQGETDENIYKMMDYFGTLVSTDQTTTDQYSSVISYPDEQVQAQVYVAEESATITAGTVGSSGSGGQVMIVKDTEVSSVSNKNLFVVGGSCINEVALKIIDPDATAPLCDSAFTDKTNVGVNQYLIKSIVSPYSDDKIALLVAGYEAADTKNAVDKAIEGVITEVGTEQVYPIVAA